MTKDMDQKKRQDLEELIEAREKAAYAKGYADALASKMSFSKESAGGSSDLNTRSNASAYRELRQMTRGVTAKLVEEHMASIAPRSIGNLDLLREIRDAKKIKLSETSVGRALEALAERNVVEREPGTKAWRYVSRPRAVGGK